MRARVLSYGLPLALAIGAALVPTALPAAYHAFADHSARLGLHPFGDVASNLAFLAAAAFVFVKARSTPESLLALSLALTCVGSWTYHLAPGDARLLLDRLPMAPAFAAMGAIVLHRDDERAATTFTLVASLLFAAAAVFAFSSGNQSFWVAAQVYVLLLVLSAAGDPEVGDAALATFALYVAAKLFETFDHQVLAATAFISGHTIKHLLAALAPVVWFALWRRAPDATLARIGCSG